MSKVGRKEKEDYRRKERQGKARKDTRAGKESKETTMVAPAKPAQSSPVHRQEPEKCGFSVDRQTKSPSRLVRAPCFFVSILSYPTILASLHSFCIHPPSTTMASSIEDNELPKSVLTRIMKRVVRHRHPASHDFLFSFQ